MGTFEQDNRIGAFGAANVQAIYGYYTSGDLTAEQALSAIAIDAGVLKRTSKQEALADIIMKVDAGELPPSVLVAAIDFVDEEEPR
jgi:hypothetical protein